MQGLGHLHSPAAQKASSREQYQYMTWKDHALVEKVVVYRTLVSSMNMVHDHWKA